MYLVKSKYCNNSFFLFYLATGPKGSLTTVPDQQSAQQPASNRSHASSINNQSETQNKSSHSNSSSKPVVTFAATTSEPQPKGLLSNYKNFFGGSEPHAPRTSQMTEKFQKQQDAITNKRFSHVAHEVIENKYKAPSFETHSSTHHSVTHKTAQVKVGRELPDAGFDYVKNRNFESVTKPEKPLDLPKGIRYNIAIGCLEKYPNWKVPPQ